MQIALGVLYAYSTHSFNFQVLYKFKDSGRSRQHYEEGHLELRQVDKDWEDPTNFVQSVYMGFLSVQRTFSMHSMPLLGGIGDSPRKIS